jgi:cytochrome P450
MTDYQPFDPEFQQNPYPHYAALRRDAPVCYVPQMRGWAVSRYDDVKYVLNNPGLYSSRIMAQADKLLLGADPPLHDRTRKVINHFFTRQRIDRLTGDIATIAGELMQPLLARGAGDLMAEYADPLVVSIITRVLGIDPAYRNDFRRWSHAYIQQVSAAPDRSESAERRVSRQAAIRELHDYFHQLIGHRMAAPQDDFTSHLLTYYTLEDVLNLCILLLVAGNETTTNLLGNTVRALLEHPNAMRQVRNNPALIPAAVTETLRYDSPVQMILRLTTQPVTLRGVDLPAGAMIMVLVGSANRDEDYYPDADCFDVHRRAHDHLAFGSGIHYCLGAQLVLLEASVALRTLLTQTRDIRQMADVPLVIAPSMQLRGLVRLEVILGPLQRFI